MVCPKCKAQLPAGAIQCPSCGTRFKTKVCPYCKSAVLATAAACPRCGKRLTPAAAPAAQSTATSSSAKGGFRWWYILIGLGIFIVGTVTGAAGMRGYILHNVTNAFNNLSSSLEDFSHSPDSSQLQSKPSAPEDEATPVSGDSGALGDYDVGILNARLSVDYEGKPAIIVGYRFTNNNEENQKFMVAISDKAFQNGVQLEPAILAGSDESYDSQNAMKDVQPGGTLEIEKAYLLQDETNDVTIEASELISLSKDKLSKTFQIPSLQ